MITGHEDQELLPATLAHEVDLPAEVLIWDEVSAYEADWISVGKATTAKGLYSLIGRAYRRASKDWGRNEYDRPYLTSGGPRMGTVSVRACSHM